MEAKKGRSPSLILLALIAGVFGIACDSPDNEDADVQGDAGADADAASDADHAATDGDADADGHGDVDLDSSPDTCDGMTCDGHGTCLLEEGVARCECDFGYVAVGGTCVARGHCDVTGATCADCADSLDYQCGTRNFCDTVLTYPDCPNDYDCVENLCMAAADRSCDGVTCDDGERCANGVCLLEATGNTYFVATWGDDDNPGTFAEPFATWQRAVTESQPGDVTYIRGGVYMPTERIAGTRIYGLTIAPSDDGYGYGVSGTAENPIRYFNYPMERPILDGRHMSPDEFRWNSGLGVDRAEHIHFRGLTVRHVYQSPPDHTHAKPYSEAFGIGTSGANFIFENMVSHNIDGRGFQHWSYAWTELDGPDALFDSDETMWINCDAYNLFDRYAEQPGNAADGWKVGGYYGNNFSWEGCRAFSYSDDGFDPHGQAFRSFRSCWAMSTNTYEGLSEDWDIEGNGFKITGVTTTFISGYVMGEESFARVEQCIAADNVGIGFYNNILVNYDDIWPNGGVLRNNLAYRNSIGYSDDNASTLRNNVVYLSQSEGPTGERHELDVANVTDYTESHNTWIAHDPSPGSWPWYYYNPDFDVTDDDFVSLDTTQLMAPRKTDGSLPSIDFGRLAPSSELIDAGTDVGLPYLGDAPDLGPFESGD